MSSVILDSIRYVIVSVAWYTYWPIKAELIIYYDWGFLITLYRCLMSHSFYKTKPVKFIPFVFNSSNIWWQVQFMKLYIMQFSPFSFTFNHKNLRTDQQCCQTQSTVFPQSHRPKVTPTFMKIPHKHVYISTVLFSESRKENKNFEAVVGITPI